MHGDAHFAPLGSWTAMTAGLAVFGMGLLRLLLQVVTLVSHLGSLWAFPSLATGVEQMCRGAVSPLLRCDRAESAGRSLWSLRSCFASRRGMSTLLSGSSSRRQLNFNLSAAGLPLALYGLQWLPLAPSRVKIPVRRKQS